jgi:WD repeat-containing protein 81
VQTLTSVVRAVFEPNEYPASITRLCAWSPDEAIPDFYDDPEVFRSIHENMADLAVPDWAQGPEDFVRRHR